MAAGRKIQLPRFRDAFEGPQMRAAIRQLEDALAEDPLQGEYTFSNKACFENVATPSTPAAGTVCLFGQNAASGVTRLQMLTSTGAVLAFFRDAVLTVRNTTGSTIPKGSAVYINGSNGTVPTVALAKADVATTARDIGLTLAAISDNSYGTVQTQGEMRGINTLAFSQGDTLWLSASVAGGLTATEPSSPNLAMRVGTVITSAASGILHLFVQHAVINWGSPPAIGNGTPNTGVFSTINKITFTQPATGATVTIADGKTLTSSNTLTLTATDGATLNIGAGGTLGSAAYTAAPTVSNFLAHNSVTDLNVTGDSTQYTVLFDTEIFDSGGNYNPSTGTFTAPATGKYRFSASVRLDGLTTAMTTQAIVLTTSNRSYQVVDVMTSPPFTSRVLTITVLADMDINDTASVSVYASGGALVADVFGDVTTVSTFFSGEFVQ